MDYAADMAQRNRDLSRVPDGVYAWLVNELGYPLSMSAPKPDWLDTRRLARAWIDWDKAPEAELDAYIAMIDEAVS